MKAARRLPLTSAAALAFACVGVGACVFIAPFPDVAPDPERAHDGGAPDDMDAADEPDTHCTPRSTRRCYSGPAGTEGVGICVAGTETCLPDGTGYGPCTGEVLPSFESCATTTDENCDGHGCTGDCLHSTGFGGGGEQRGSAIAVSRAAVVMSGSASGAIDFGASTSNELGTPSTPDCFLVSFSRDGKARWSRRFADSASHGVAVAEGGDIVLAGASSGDVDFGGGSLGGHGNGDDVFVARFDPSGGHRWSRRFGNGANQFATAVAVDATGNTIITGGFWGKLDFGAAGEGEDTKIESAGGSDAFVAKLDARGVILWAKAFGDAASNQSGTGIAVDGEGNVIVVGTFAGTINLGGADLVSQRGTDMFIAKLSAAGDHLWSEAADSGNAAKALAVAVDGARNIFATGSFRTSMVLGKEQHTNGGDKDVFLLKLDEDGTPLWSKAFGDAADQEGVGLTVDPAGDVVVTGAFLGRIDFGLGPLTATGASDGFLAKFDPRGAPIWAHVFGDAAEQSGTAVATDPLGDTWATGYFSGSADFGKGTLSSSGTSDAFLVELGP